VPAAHWILNPPYGVYEAADGWIALAMADPVVLGEAIGSPRVTALATWEEAATQRELVFEECERALRGRTVAEWIELFDRHGIWAGPVHRYEDLPDDPQIRAEGYFQPVPTAAGGSFLMPDNAIKFLGTANGAHRPPPTVSQHAEDVLAELGIDGGERERLFDSGCVVRRS
jgi:crotonobetainyl-CoA:carnitine CoA-transferase CaiB-like acyl-CoA transferase